MKRVFYFCCGVLLVLGFFARTSLASKSLEIVSYGEYVMGAGETMEVAEEKAKKAAMQKAAEQAGAFVKSYTKVKNFALESDEVEVIANHSMKVEILEKKRTVLGDAEAIRFFVKIKATLTPEEIEANLKKVREDRRIVDEYNRREADFEKLNREVEKLKKQLEIATGGDRQKIVKLISEEEKKYKANLWLERAQSLSDFDEEKIKAYKKALELNPELAQAYMGIADVLRFQNMGEPQNLTGFEKKMNGLREVLKNLDKAIEIDDNYADAYALRAEILNEMKNREFYWKEEGENFEEKRKDYNKQILIDINRALALNASDKGKLYRLKASLYMDELQSTELEQRKAGESKPEIIEEYCNKAISEIDRAISICKEGDLSCLSENYAVKAAIYGGTKNYFGTEGNSAKEKEFAELERMWRGKVEALERQKEARVENAEEVMYQTELGKIFYEIEMNGWRERVLGISLRDLEKKSDVEQKAILKPIEEKIRQKVSKGAATAEEYIYVALLEKGINPQNSDKYFKKGIELLEKRNPEGIEALLLARLCMYWSSGYSSNQQYDAALNLLNKAKGIVNRHIPKSLALLDVNEFKRLSSILEDEEGIKNVKLTKEQAESFYFIMSLVENSRSIANIYEKLDLKSKAKEEYKYICETLKDETACKDVERLK